MKLEQLKIDANGVIDTYIQVEAKNDKRKKSPLARISLTSASLNPLIGKKVRVFIYTHDTAEVLH